MQHRNGYKPPNWKNKGTAFVSAPDHELFNLNGIDFYGKNSILEEGMSHEKNGNNNDKGSIINDLKFS